MTEKRVSVRLRRWAAGRCAPSWRASARPGARLRAAVARDGAGQRPARRLRAARADRGCGRGRGAGGGGHGDDPLGAADVVDAQAKLAASLDTTVESIQVLERAGDLAGVSMGQVEQATMQLTRRLSQAAAGTGPAVEALRRLRLSAGELQALPLDQRIALIQDRLADLVPEAERAAVASQLFGDRAALVFTRIDTRRCARRRRTCATSGWWSAIRTRARSSAPTTRSRGWA
jgi:hypothetical protein